MRNIIAIAVVLTLAGCDSVFSNDPVVRENVFRECVNGIFSNDASKTTTDSGFATLVSDCADTANKKSVVCLRFCSNNLIDRTKKTEALRQHYLNQ